MSTLVPPILHYRGPWFSALHLPDPAFLAALGDKMPYAFLLFNAASDGASGATTVGAQQVGRGSFNAPDGAYITHLIASSNQAAGFMAQFYDSERQVLWNADPIFFGNGFGTAQKPYYLLRPYRVPVGGLLQSKITNLATVAAQIQVVAWGVRD